MTDGSHDRKRHHILDSVETMVYLEWMHQFEERWSPFKSTRDRDGKSMRDSRAVLFVMAYCGKEITVVPLLPFGSKLTFSELELLNE